LGIVSEYHGCARDSCIYAVASDYSVLSKVFDFVHPVDVEAAVESVEFGGIHGGGYWNSC
jgi:hypothetical protein